MFDLLRGIWQLRDPLLVRDLGERRFHLAQIHALRQQFPQAKLSSDITLINHQPQRLTLTGSVTISENTILAFGDDLNGYGNIVIGDRTWIGQYNNLRSGGGNIVIGEDCLISQFCTLVASNHQKAKDKPIKIQPSDQTKTGVILGNDVWLGAGVTILPGVKIGNGTVVGANAVVNRDLPDYEIWGGVPARKLGER
ncbi:MULTISPECIES: acyltransferase [unclassified Synechocystis]|uniref:acyltransferase n=1 Tax=unclassified Synechocystis TaxID=2640012 RepID=UPI0004D192DA|nr:MULTISPECIES: acyltransferase [unclassified Synechocystis]AIE74669.1 Chloramphenicol acetyltransferase [Synechocystis sp. PCC 6714]MCT0253975.1 acyltransferase [Synechocystis sp. CS-94]